APDATQVTIDDVVFDIQLQETISASCLETFCEYAKSQLQLQHVLGGDMGMMRQWFTKLETSLQMSSGSQKPEQNILARVQQLQRQCHKALKTQVQQVLQLANSEKLNTLNSQQQADYLRQSTSNSLAKRTARNVVQQQERGETQSLQAQTEAILQMITAVECKETDACERSFYSVTNNSELFATLAEQKIRVDVLTELDILRLVGVMGVCYHAKVGDCLDPYNFHVLSILGGGFLSTNDLREANSTLVCGQQAELMAPGTTTIITGVLPLRYLNPQLFDIVWKDGMKLLEAHASINMRRMLAPVRSDLLGERIAVLCCIM